MKKFGSIFIKIICLYLLTGCFVSHAPVAYASSVTKASTACIEFIKNVEGFSPQPYYDYNQYTVGYGTKCPSEKYFEYKANGIPKYEAEALLKDHIANIETAIQNKLVGKYNLTLTQNQLDALVSFSFNIGTDWMTYDSSLRNAILIGSNDNDIVYAFSLYCTAGGKYLPGLITRRLCEANIYLNGIYSQKISDSYGYVYYDANGGTLTYQVQGFLCNAGTAPAANAVRSEDEFLGWYTNVSGGEKIDTLNGSLTGRTLFAHWKSLEHADHPTSSSTLVEVTGDIVNIRSGPGTNYSIVRKAYMHEVLTVSHITHLTNMRWGNVQDGWICLDYTNYDDVINGIGSSESDNDADSSNSLTAPGSENSSVTDTPSEIQVLVSGIVNVNDALRIRSGPGTSYPVVGFLFNGSEVDILAKETVSTTEWGRISKGWVCMDYIITDTIHGNGTIGSNLATSPDQQPPQDPTQEPSPLPNQPPMDSIESSGSISKGKIKADALRIRAAAGTANPIVGFYYQNEIIEISEKVLIDSVYWGKTHRGWINMDYVTITSSSEETAQPAKTGTMTVIADCLRVRKGTGTDYRISALLYYGDTITVFDTVTVDGTVWGRVDKGWICMDYVE